MPGLSWLAVPVDQVFRIVAVHQHPGRPQPALDFRSGDAGRAPSAGRPAHRLAARRRGDADQMAEIAEPHVAHDRLHRNRLVPRSRLAGRGLLARLVQRYEIEVEVEAGAT